ncbi:MAG: primosomal protein N', partial [Gammaproteobacteria bacterium]
RVRVPFGRRHLVGLVTEVRSDTDVPGARLKRAERLLDDQPLIPDELMDLARWVAEYYRHPAGEVHDHLLPGHLRRGRPAERPGTPRWVLTDEGRSVSAESLRRAPRQAALASMLREANAPLTQSELAAAGGDTARALKALADRGLVRMLPPSADTPAQLPTKGPELNNDQAAAAAAISSALGGFQAFLLDGVTGSGKTEVYLAGIRAAVARDEQALVLVPEIALTPQLVARFRARLGCPVAVFHSGLNDSERLAAWLDAASGETPVVIGTRSAVFMPLKHPGLIVVDEEHDTSYKQQEGLRYSARDLAVMRGQRNSVPVVLGSATPSLESLFNVRQGRYRHLPLPERAGAASHPVMRVLDVRSQPLSEGLSPTLLAALDRHLAAGGQALLFLNRRGFSPVLICHDCGWVGECRRCDARLTFHQRRGRLCCHHCGAEQGVPRACPECGREDLRALGQGTERLESALQGRFPGMGVTRIDRDTVQRRGAMEQMLDRVHAGEARILIGTQMLAKGHDFPGVTLVGIVDADQGLFSPDFRATERMAQLIVQVSGRAGRADRPGEVLIQTHQPEHPLLLTLIRKGYPEFARACLAERKAARLPPYSAMALLRAESTDPRTPPAFLRAARDLALADPASRIAALGPVPAPMERRAGRYRFQLLFQADRRARLQVALGQLVPRLDGLPESRRVRWSVDVDPADLF